jgi:hypothetical protein
MARFWRPAIIAAMSSFGRRANSVRQRMYSPCRDEILRAAVADGLWTCLTRRRSGWRAPSVQDAAICPCARPDRQSERPWSARGLTPRCPPGTSGRLRTLPRPRPALNSDMTVSGFRDHCFWILYTVRAGSIGLLLRNPTSTVSIAPLLPLGGPRPRDRERTVLDRRTIRRSEPDGTGGRREKFPRHWEGT